jgi:hypothetical protein
MDWLDAALILGAIFYAVVGYVVVRAAEYPDVEDD